MEIIQKYELKKARKVRDQLELLCLQFMNYHRQYASFPEPQMPQLKSWYGFMRDLDIFRHCVVRLLKLEILHSNMSNDGAGYAYHWTPLGKKVMELIPAVPVDDYD